MDVVHVNVDTLILHSTYDEFGVADLLAEIGQHVDELESVRILQGMFTLSFVLRPQTFPKGKQMRLNA